MCIKVLKLHNLARACSAGPVRWHSKRDVRKGALVEASRVSQLSGTGLILGISESWGLEMWADMTSRNRLTTVSHVSAALVHCGGTAGAPTAAAALDAPWPGQICAPHTQLCARQSAAVWLCAARPGAAGAPPPPPLLGTELCPPLPAGAGLVTLNGGDRSVISGAQWQSTPMQGV